jgi:hypothetical protein
MAVMIEGMTLVFENSTLEEKHPLGIYGFKKMWDNGSYCTDGTISRLAFFEAEDAFAVFHAMQDIGLETCMDFAMDVAIFSHGGGLWVPCVWLEHESVPKGYHYCWHAAEEVGKVSVPGYFRRGTTIAALQGMSGVEMRARLSRAGTQDKWAVLRDSSSEKIYLGPHRLERH